MQMIQQLKNNVHLNYAHSKQFDVPEHKVHYNSKNMEVVTIKYWVSPLQCYFLKKDLEICSNEKLNPMSIGLLLYSNQTKC